MYVCTYLGTLQSYWHAAWRWRVKGASWSLGWRDSLETNPEIVRKYAKHLVELDIFRFRAMFTPSRSNQRQNTTRYSQDNSK